MHTVTARSHVIDLDAFASLLASSVVQSTMDLHAVLIYRAIHPVYGFIMLVNTAGDKQGVFYLP